MLAGDAKTATGPVIVLADPFVWTAADGTSCESVSGTIRDSSGATVGFNIAGVLTGGQLAPEVQRRIETARAVKASAGALVLTIGYDEDVVTLCDLPYGNLVTSAASAAAPTPTPTSTPSPTATATATPTATATAVRPQPTAVPHTTGTVTGRVRWSPASAFVFQRGSVCRVWKGSVKPASGPAVELALMSPVTGTPATGLRATDGAVVKLAAELQSAYLQRAKATVTYAGPVEACGVTLDRVVTALAVAPGPKPKSRTRSGTMLQFGLAGEYQGCRVWTGSLQYSGGFTLSFAVVTELRNGRAVDPSAARIAAELRRALKQHRRVRVTFSGPITSCGVRRAHVISRVTVSRARSRAS